MKTDSDIRQSVITGTGTAEVKVGTDITIGDPVCYENGPVNTVVGKINLSTAAELNPMPGCVFKNGKVVSVPPGWTCEELGRNSRTRLMRKTIKTVIELDEFNNTEIIELSKIMHEQGGKAEG